MTHYHDKALSYHRIVQRQVKGPRAMPAQTWGTDYLAGNKDGVQKPRSPRFVEADRSARVRLMRISRALMAWDRKLKTSVELLDHIRKIAEGEHG